ncbi:MAG: hypothetical protein HKL88_00275 [Bacteroidia bacterium]|jgi:hypothetical protein|nr:hypothetical protein [Bacteroidia bacterium]
MKTTIYSNRKEAIRIKLFIILFLIAFFTIARVTHGQNAAQPGAAAGQQYTSNWVSQMNHVADLLNLYADQMSERAAGLRDQAAKATTPGLAAELRKKADACDALAGEKRNERGVLLVIIDKASPSPKVVAMNDK